MAAYAEPTTSLHLLLLKAVEVAHETKRAAPGRRDTRHETNNSHHHLVAHDDVLVHSWRAPLTSPLIQPLNAVEGAPGRRGTRHGTSDSHRLASNDHAILNFELPRGAEERGHFGEGARAGLEKKPSCDCDSASRRLPYFFGSRCASA
jgi:hypothetical protein